MQLSQNFTLFELKRSDTAARHGISNAPNQQQIESLRALCVNILQPIRDEFSRQVRVNSGFRCPELNRIIGGSKNSQHMDGEAADIEIRTVSNLELAKWISISGLPFDQLILEFHNPDDGPNSGWVHVSHRPLGNQRGMVLTAKHEDGKSIFVGGLDP